MFGPFNDAVQTFTGDHVPELREQPDQSVTAPRLTGKVITIGVDQAVSLRELRTAILGTTHTVNGE